MTPEQETQLFTMLTDIHKSQSRVEQKVDSHLIEDAATHARHEEGINQLYHKTNEHGKQIARIKGIGLGVSGLFSMLLAVLGLERFGG